MRKRWSSGDEYRLFVSLGSSATAALSASGSSCIEMVCKIENRREVRNSVFYTNMTN